MTSILSNGVNLCHQNPWLSFDDDDDDDVGSQGQPDFWAITNDGHRGKGHLFLENTSRPWARAKQVSCPLDFSHLVSKD